MRTADRCVGAQYVASLDGSAAGGLIEMPRVGAAMLFARTDDRGRISLVRTGIVTSFESMVAEDPFVDSVDVETSAPVLATKSNARKSAVRGADPQQLSVPSEQEDEEEDEDDLVTAEYAAAIPQRAVRSAHASNRVDRAPTLRGSQPNRSGDTTSARTVLAPSRGTSPQRSDSRACSAAAYAWPSDEEPTCAPRAPTSDVQIAPRRR